MTEIPRSDEWDRLLAELTQPVGRADPYPRYEQLRREAPVVRAEDGAVVLTRYADCHAVLRSQQVGHTDQRLLLESFGFEWREHPGVRTLATSILTLNPPEHTRLRRLVSGVFTARRVAALEPAVERLVDGLVEDLAGHDDFVDALAFPLPVAVISELLGVPEEDRAPFQPLVRDWTMLLDAFTPEILETADRAAAQIREYLTGLLRERRARPREDLLSALAQRQGGESLDEDEAVTMAALLFAAGFETTTHLLGNGLVALLEHPEEAQRWRTADDLDASAVEELLRFDSSVQITSREVSGEVRIGEHVLGAGERLVLYLGAANRDPATYADPDRLDLARKGPAPMSFGGGIHYCLGAPLARLEARLAFPRLLRRYPDLEVTGPGERRDSLTLRGYLSLPVAT
jgi:cytochrome P450